MKMTKCNKVLMLATLTLFICLNMLTGCHPIRAKENKIELEEVKIITKDEKIVDGKVEVVLVQTLELAETNIADQGSASLMAAQRYITLNNRVDSFSVSNDDKVVLSLWNDPENPYSGVDLWIAGGGIGMMRLTNSDHINLNASFSNDSSQVYFTSRRDKKRWDPREQADYLWRMSVKGGGGITRIGSPAYSYLNKVVESPNGENILYSTLEKFRTYDEKIRSNASIWVSSTNGKLPTQIAQGYAPVWLDNETIVYTANDSNHGKSTIWSVKIDGSQRTQFISDTNNNCLQPMPSPNGRLVAYVMEDIEDRLKQERSKAKESSRDIYIYNFETGLSQQITTNRSRDDMPGWSSDGKFLLFRSTRGASQNIWRVNVVNLFPASVFSSKPAPSPAPVFRSEPVQRDNEIRTYEKPVQYENIRSYDVQDDQDSPWEYGTFDNQ